MSKPHTSESSGTIVRGCYDYSSSYVRTSSPGGRGQIYFCTVYVAQRTPRAPGELAGQPPLIVGQLYCVAVGDREKTRRADETANKGNED